MANEHSGSLVTYGVGIEATRGTAEAAPDVWYPRISGVISDKVETDEVEVAQGVVTNDVLVKPVKTWSEGDFEGLIADVNFGFILTALFGDCPTATLVEASVYSHTFDFVQSNTHKSLTIFKKDPIATYKYPYFMINELTIEFVKDQMLRFTMSGKGKKAEADTDAVTITAQNYFSPADFTLKLATNQAGLDAANEVVVSRATLKVSKGVEDGMMEWNDGEPSFIGNGSVKITGEIELLYTGVTEHDYVLNNTAKAIRMAVEKNTLIGATKKPSMTWDIYEAYFSSFDSAEEISALRRQTLEFRAVYNIAGSKLATCVLQNTRATDYDA